MEAHRGHQEPEVNVKRSAYVVVLGDLGRSPRMCNHAVSLADEGFDVTLVGYGGSRLRPDVAGHPKIRAHEMLEFPGESSGLLVARLPRVLRYALKAVWQTVCLLLALPAIRGPDLILLQNPPSVPALPVCYAYCKLHFGTRLILDWHNYGDSVLALALGPRHPLVRATRHIESYYGSRAHKAFCVSRAMKADLVERFNIPGEPRSLITLYDKPKDCFTSLKPRLDRPFKGVGQDLFRKLASEYPEFAGWPGSTGGVTPARVVNRALLVSSTSWTEDEDFSVLFDALNLYENQVKQQQQQDDGGGSDEEWHRVDDRSEETSAGQDLGDDALLLPDLLCVITGKGPLKEFYAGLIKDQRWSHVRVVTPWLEPEDYPLLLASADLGVCLHFSSSGVDLPMKVVDMFGCGLPVVARNFKALPELVRHQQTGLIFDDAEGLSQCLFEWFGGFGTTPQYLARSQRFRTNIEAFRAERWSEYWRKVAGPTFLSHI